MTGAPTTEKYDVAFSFLDKDRPIAHEFRALLEPALHVFVYDREQESVGGQDGAEGYSRIFKHETRLTVILFRDGWGETRFTGIEEAAIRDRATRNRFRSMMVVMMDPGQTLPAWIPETTVYQHGWEEPRAETAAVIRARARDVGAVLKPVTLVDIARQKAEQQRLRVEREQLLQSPAGAGVARSEARRLVQEIVRRVEHLTEEVPALRLHVREDQSRHPSQPGCIISGPRRTLVVRWVHPQQDTLYGTRLEIFDSPTPGMTFQPGRAPRPRSASGYQFGFTEDGQPGWCYQPDPDAAVIILRDFKATPTSELLEESLRGLVEDNLSD